MNRRRPRILVADDEADIRMLCRVNLEFEGFEVLEATDGEQAVATARASAPDLILLDSIMPRKDGWETLSELKADPDLAKIPVILLTARVETGVREQALRQGASGYVAKPFRPPDLIGAIEELLEG